MRYNLPTYGLTDDHLAAIGSVCVAWSMLEAHLNFLVSSLMGYRSLRDQQILAGALDMRNKTTLAQTFAHEKLKDKENFDMLDKLLLKIDNEIRNERNRIVHDLWVASGPVRLQIKPRFEKKPFLPRELNMVSEVPMSANQIRQFANVIDGFSQSINFTAFFHLAEKAGESPPWHDICFEPFLLLNSYQDHMTQAQTPPPKASEE